MLNMRSGKNAIYRMKRIAALLIGIAAALTMLLPVAASEQKSGKNVRVGWYESPFNMMDDAGRRSGYAYEYQQKIAAYSGWDYEYVEGSWPELMQKLIDGEIDLMSDVSYTPERKEQMFFSELAMGAEEYYVFMFPGNSEIRPDDPHTLDGKKIGVNKGSIQAGLFREWAAQYGIETELIEQVCDESESMQMMRDGRLDAYVTLDVFRGWEDSVPVFRIGSSDFFFAVNRKRPDLLAELNTAMTRIQNENRYYDQQLSRKYISSTGANLFLSTEDKNWLSAHGKIRVGYKDNFLAFSAADKKTGELTGALKNYLDYASVCFKNAQLEFEPVPYPTTSAAMEALKNKEVDCVFPSTLSTADGETSGFFMTPAMMSTDIYAVVRSDDRGIFSEKKSVTAAIEANAPNYDAIIQDHFHGWKTAEYPNIRACLKAVAEGNADCALVSNYQYNSLERLFEQYDLTMLATGESVGLYFAVNRGDNELYSILTRTTGLVNGTAINAALNYYSSEVSEITLGDFIRQNPFLVGAFMLGILALIVIVVIQHRLIAARKDADESRHMFEDLNKQAFVDPLTHVKNRGAYAQWEEKFNEEINNGEREAFAVVVCDINNLKTVNDLYGHKEGDICIKNACAKICRVFSHSPVFRIGGDEFVILLSGEDYNHRKELMKQINALPGDRSKIKLGETVSAGIAEYDKSRHSTLLSVFEEADKAMYERKQFMKKTFPLEETKTETDPVPEYIPVIHARKTILIADDIEMNREILSDLLEDDYNIVFAEDGVQTLEVLRSHKDEIDLVLLDLQMPKKSGREVIAEMQVDEDLMSIPVIFLTVDQAAELDCLKIGAMDFIPKPYPDIEIVKARIAKCIELSENRELIRFTERDKLTGLLNKDYFYRYVSRLDHLYKGTPLDAVVCDINRFHSANKQYGRQFGDRVLRCIGNNIKKIERETGGIGCRQGGDIFLLYCPHQDDYERLFRGFMADISADEEIAGRIKLRFGVFVDAHQEPDIEERFVRARIAADRVKDDEENICGFYDLN